MTWFFFFSEKDIETLAETHDLCIGGDSIEMLQATSAVLRVIPFVKVYTPAIFVTWFGIC